jgi:two-component system cell cycle sensor histidine kinase PleC
MALAHQRRVDIGLALPATGEAAAVAVGLADLAMRHAARQQRLQGAARLTSAGDLAAIARGAALAVFRRVDSFKPQLLTKQPHRIAVDRLGRPDELPCRAKPVLQDRAGQSEKAEQAERHDEVDRPADTAPAEGSIAGATESEGSHQEELNDLVSMMASRTPHAAGTERGYTLPIMTEVTAEQVQRGRGPDPSAVARRKQVTREVRSARERLTSSTGLERAFDNELLRVFAQYRIAGSAGTLVLVLGIAAASCLWLPTPLVAVWSGSVLLTTMIIVLMARRFLAKVADEVRLKFWRRLFALAEGMHGLAWSLLLLLFVPVDAPGAKVFVTTALLIVSALTVMLSATIPIAVYAGLSPIIMGIMVFFWDRRDMDSVTMALMAASAQLFFIFLANRLYASSVASIVFRAEKDALIAELETANANSDEARRKAEEANLAKSRFLATMSHELRTPLNAILGFSEVMKNEIFGGHANAAYKEYSADIHGSGQHLLNLINEILDLSRIEAGKYELNEEALSLPSIVDDCQHMLALRAKAKGQSIRALAEPSLPRVWADERAIRQAVLNVLSNAIKFTPQGGEITVKVGWTATGGQYVSVADNGPGIPENEIPIVMQSFGRGSLAIKTAEQGSGLGLPIVKGLIDLHGGGFHLKSKPRAGTEVTITLPAERVMDTLAALPEPKTRAA